MSLQQIGSTRNGTSDPGPTVARVYVRRVSAALLGLSLALAVAAGTADDTIQIDSAPVSVLSGAGPNLILTLDDSRSMNRAFLPDDIWQDGSSEPQPQGDGRDTANVVNSQYYNPAVTYLPPIGADAEQLPHAEFSAAPLDPLRAVWDTSDSCQAAQTRTGSCGGDYAQDRCVLDLSRNYAALWDMQTMGYYCKDFEFTQTAAATDPATTNPEYQLRAYYTPDVEHRAWRPPHIRNSWDSVRKGKAWALRCMAAGSAGDCPAYYHRWKGTGDYHDGASRRQCSDLDLTAVKPKDYPQTCLQRVLVGSDEDIDVITDKSKQDITARVLADRRSKLIKSGENLTDADLDKALAKRNFANWFSYYRNRFMAIQTVSSRVMDSLPRRVRLGYQTLTSGEYKAMNPAAPSAERDQGVAYERLAGTFKPYSDTDARQGFYGWLYSLRANGQTYLVSAALRVYELCRSEQAYAEHPQWQKATGAAAGRLITPVSESGNPLRGCRNNFHVIFTDGYWEDSMPIDGIVGFKPPSWLGNNDGDSHDLPAQQARNLGLGTPTTYSPSDSTAFQFEDSTGVTRSATMAMYPDQNTGTLADVAFQSWVTDLLPGTGPGAEDAVPPIINNPTGTIVEQFWNPENDLADWQHITTFTVGFGVAGNTKFPSGDWTFLGPSGTETSGNLYTQGLPGAWNATISSTNPLQGLTGATLRNLKIDDTWHAGINGRGGYLNAGDPDALTASFNQVLSIVARFAGDSAVAAVAVNTGSTTGDDRFYQATLDSSDWSGDVRAYRISSGSGKAPCPTVAIPGQFCPDSGPGGAYRSAQVALDGQLESGYTRRIFTVGTGNEPVAFASTSWSELTDIQRSDFLLGAGYSGAPNLAPAAQVTEAKERLDYVAGDETYETPGLAYRFRPRKTLLGDFVNAAPVVVARPAYYYKSPGYLSAASPAGTAFKTRWRNRTPIVYAGANDGMLHAFDGENLTEIFAFVPPVLMGLENDPRPTNRRQGLRFLSDPAYGSGAVAHRAYVDGQLATGDALFGTPSGGDWHTVLVGGLGLGAQALFALDVTEPPGAADVDTIAGKAWLWQITDRDDRSSAADHWDPDLGYVFGRPAIVRICGSGTPEWVAVIGNGYNSAEADGSRALGCDDPAKDQPNSGHPGDTNAPCGQAVLFVISLQNGTIRRIPTNVGRLDDPNFARGSASQRPNGLGAATVIATATDATYGDTCATYAYAGDLFGNVYRFDLSPTATNPVRTLFSARGPDAIASTTMVSQPITSRIAVAYHPSGQGRMVLFGTGRYLSVDDVSDRTVQSFYGVWDTFDDTRPAPTRNDLVRQEFELTNLHLPDADPSAAGIIGRTSSANAVDWTTKRGWYIDFTIELDSTGKNKGERVVVDPRVQGNRVTFVSLVPENNPCAGGGKGWVNVLDLRSGSPFVNSPYDTNWDGVIDQSDKFKISDTEAKAGTSYQVVGPSGGSTGVYSTTTVSPEGDTLFSGSHGERLNLPTSRDEGWRVWQQLY